ncbi:MAG: hypothetical protein OET90_12195, partial [Desulfuromonadales bacterium]|nr:hypothetical protein [Desulfuromonadales bacterium]
MASNRLFETGWGIPKEYALASLPEVPKSERGCLDALERWAEGKEDYKRKRPGTKAYEFNYSIMPEAAQTALLLKHPEIAVQTVLNTSENQLQNERLERLKDYDRDSLWSYFSAKPQKVKDAAAQKLKAIQTVESLLLHGMKKGPAKEAVVNAYIESMRISFSTLGKWMKAVEGYDRQDWLPVLVDKHAGRQKEADCAPEAWEFFKADYLRRCKPSVADCYDRLERAAKEHGWSIPSDKTLSRKLNREIPRQVILLAREGADALTRAYPSQERDHSVFHAMQAINGDGYTFF